MIKHSTLIQSPMYYALRQQDLIFTVYYIRYNKYINPEMKRSPCAVVVLAQNKDKILTRGIAICSSSESNFNAMYGFELAAIRVLKAFKHKEDEEFQTHEYEIQNKALATFKLYAEKAELPVKKGLYNATMTKKEENRFKEVGMIGMFGSEVYPDDIEEETHSDEEETKTTLSGGVEVVPVSI